MIAPSWFRVGDDVVYRSHDGKLEDGIVTSISDRFVFVRFRDMYPTAPGKACDPRDLTPFIDRTMA